MKPIYPSDVENAAASLDTQCFRIYCHTPKAMNWDTQQADTYSHFDKKEVSTQSMSTQVSRLYSDSPDTDTDSDGRQEAVKQQPIEEESPVDIATMKPGARLRHAREQKKLSAQHIADRLYLDVSVIKIVEADDYEHLPSPIFVRGYLRNYAKLLDIPAESIIEAYDLLGQQQPPPLTFHLKSNNQAKSEDSWVKATTFTIIIVLMILTAMWRFSPNLSSLNQSPPVEQSPERSNAQVLVPIQPPANASESSQTTSTTTEFTPPVEENADNNETSTQAEPTKNPALVKDIAAKGSATPKPAAESQPTVTPTAPTATTSSTASATTTPPIAATSTGTAATKKSDTVRVLLNKETWMRIQDSHGKQLFDGIGKAGKDIELTGTPPFKVKVGHTEGIVVEYKGEKTEFKDYPNRNGKSITIGTTASSNNE